MSVTVFQNKRSGGFSINPDLWAADRRTVFRILGGPEELKEFVDSGKSLTIMRYSQSSRVRNPSNYSIELAKKDFQQFSTSVEIGASAD
jgi:hypothetical protein